MILITITFFPPSQPAVSGEEEEGNMSVDIADILQDFPELVGGAHTNPQEEKVIVQAVEPELEIFDVSRKDLSICIAE